MSLIIGLYGLNFGLANKSIKLITSFAEDDETYDQVHYYYIYLSKFPADLKELVISDYGHWEKKKLDEFDRIHQLKVCRMKCTIHLKMTKI